MKQLFTFILVTLMAVAHAQTLTWEQTGIKVPAGNADAVVALVEGFYSSIDFPEGVSLELSAVCGAVPSEPLLRNCPLTPVGQFRHCAGDFTPGGQVQGQSTFSMQGQSRLLVGF